MVEAKERPIIFSGESVRAILEGRKTQTRRTRGLEDVNNYPGILSGRSAFFAEELGYKGLAKSDYYIKNKMDYAKYPGLYYWFLGQQGTEINPIPVKYPYGQPGDRLWVRETWALLELDSYGLIAGIAYRADGEMSPNVLIHHQKIPNEKWSQVTRQFQDGRKWRPSIHMPRWASRITLEVVDKWIERVQDISIDDIYAEGCPPISSDKDGSELYEWYFDLWDSLNAKRGFSWEFNPWVFATEFKKIESNP